MKHQASKNQWAGLAASAVCAAAVFGSIGVTDYA